MKSRTLAVVAIAFVVASVGGGGEAPAEGTVEPAKAKRVVVSPRAGQVVHRHRVRIRVRARDLSGVLRARLNGVDVSGEFSRARRGVRTLDASLSHGLRRGRNALRVRVRQLGRPTRRATVRFRVRRSRTLTGAGRDRRVMIRSTWRLRGRAVKAKGEGRPIRARWRLVRAPRRSRARVPAAAAAAPAVLTRPARLISAFRPDVPGQYVLRLTAGSGAGRASDTVKLDAVRDQPLITVDTMSGDPSNPGIGVGGTNYPLAKATGSGPLQVLVLTRKHLAVVSNTRFTSADALAAMLRTPPLKDDSLVIVSWQSGAGGFSGDLDGALAQIGWPKIGPIDKTRPGSLSAIGVPGMQRGDADVKLNQDAPGAPPRAGRIQGYLSPDQWTYYGFVPSQRIPFSYTPATPRPPDTPEECGATCAGFLVWTQDPYTLERANFNYYPLGDPSLSAGAHNNNAALMINILSHQVPGALITIRAVSTPTANGTYLPPVGNIDRPVLRQVAELVADAGGTRDGFNSVARLSGSPASRGASYTLVGWKGAGEGAGAETAAGADGASAAPVLTGVLQPDRTSQFKPASVKKYDAATDAPDTDALATLTLEPPTRGWPLDDDPGASKALAWLGSQDLRLSSDPRSTYWSQGFPTSTWLDIIDTIEKVRYQAGNGFTQADFDAAQEELLQELHWVFKVRSYLDELMTPFAANALESWTAAHMVAHDVYEAVNPPKNEAAFEWLEFTQIVLDLAGPLTDHVSAEIGALLEFGVTAYGASAGGSPTTNEVEVAADQLGDHIGEQATAAQAAIRRMGDVIVSDYAKLKILGTYASCKPTDEKCRKEFAFTDDDRVTASAVMFRAIKRIAYEKIVPLGFPVFQLLRTNADQPVIHRQKPPDIQGYNCGGSKVYYYVPAGASVSLLNDLDPAGQDNGYDTYLLAQEPGAFTQYATGPPDSIWTKMFGDVDPTDPHKGGYAVSRSDFMREAHHEWWWGEPNRESEQCRWDF